MLRKTLNTQNIFILSVVVQLIAFLTGSYTIFFIAYSLCLVSLIVFEFLNKSNTNKTAFWFYAFENIGIMAIILRNLDYVWQVTKFLTVAFLTIAVISTIMLVFALKPFKNLTIQNVWSHLKRNYVKYLIILLLVLLSLDCFHTYPKWDSKWYFDALKNINITNFNNVTTLKLCDHITIMYSIPIFMLYSIVGDLYSAVIIFNILCNVLAFMAVYAIIEKLCPNSTKLFKLLSSSIFAFSVYTFGMSGYVYVDVFMMYTVLFFLASYLYGDKSTIFVASLFAIFSKEVGALIVLLMIFVPMIISFVKCAKAKEINTWAKENMTIFHISIAILIVIFMAVFFIKNWADNSNVFIKFGLGGYHTLATLYILMIPNFNWVITLIILSSLCIVLTKMWKTKMVFHIDKSLYPIIATLGISSAFNLFVITYDHLRYLLIEISMLYIIGFKCLSYIIENLKPKRQIIFSVLLTTMLSVGFIHNYITVDPLMLINRSKIYTGKYDFVVVYPSYPLLDMTDTNMSDSIIYNKQLNTFDRAIDKMLDIIDYNETKTIVYSSMAYKKLRLNEMAWNSVTHKRYFTDDETKRIKEINLFNQDESLIETNKTYYFIDFNSRHGDKTLNDYFADTEIEIINSTEIEHFEFRFTITEFRKL